MLKFVNQFLVQFLFVRITKMVEADGSISGWGLTGPVLPLTGWSSPYIPKDPPMWWFWKRNYRN